MKNVDRQRFTSGQIQKVIRMKKNLAPVTPVSSPATTKFPRSARIYCRIWDTLYSRLNAHDSLVAKYGDAFGEYDELKIVVFRISGEPHFFYDMGSGIMIEAQEKLGEAPQFMEDFDGLSKIGHLVFSGSNREFVATSFEELATM